MVFKFRTIVITHAVLMTIQTKCLWMRSAKFLKMMSIRSPFLFGFGGEALLGLR